MVAPKSTHLSEMAGATEAVIGELIVDTGLRDIQSCVASFNETNFVPDEEQFVSCYRLKSVKPEEPASKIVIRVEKGGANSGTLGDTVIKVDWLAIGR